VEKEKANFSLTGALAKDEKTGNMKNGIVLKHSEPFDSAAPDKQWRFYVFKDDKLVETLYLHRQKHYLAGRDERVADLLIAHPSCSKQHAVVQFREIRQKQEYSLIEQKEVKEIRPYLMDLQSAHKTFLNNKPIEDSRYYELREKDCVKFGGSTREYVLLHDSSDKLKD
jgi:smad nuclear-interacting protein 1